MRRWLVVRSWILLVCAALAVIMVPATPADAATRTMKVLVVPVHWGTKLDTRSTARRLISTDTGGWLSTVSRKRLRLSTTVAPVSKITAGCARVTERAKAAAVRKGYRLSRYDLVVVLAPTCARYSTERHANLTLHRHPAELTLYGKQGRSLSTTTHQFGFLLGLDAEAKRYSCTTAGRPVTIAASKRCYRITAFADIDTMGGSDLAGSYAAPELEDLGWLKSSEVVKRRSGTATVRLAPLLGTGVRVIKARAEGATYWVEYRTRTGVDRNLDPALAGVRIWRSTDADNRLYGQRRYHVIDMRGSDTSGIDPLRPGSTWTSPEGLAFTVRAVTAKSATVTVRFEAPSPKTPIVPRLQVSSGDEEVIATWGPAADRGRPVSYYDIEARPAGGRWTNVQTVTVDGVREARIHGVNGKRIEVRVRAQNDLGFSAWSVGSAVPAPLLPSVQIISPAPTTVLDGSTVRVVVAARPNPSTQRPVDSVLIGFGWADVPASRQPDGTWAATLDLAAEGDDGELAISARAYDTRSRHGDAQISVTVPQRLPTPALVEPTGDPVVWTGDTLVVHVDPGTDRLTGAPPEYATVRAAGARAAVANADNDWTVTFDRSALPPAGVPIPSLRVQTFGGHLFSDLLERPIVLG